MIALNYGNSHRMPPRYLIPPGRTQDFLDVPRTIGLLPTPFTKPHIERRSNDLRALAMSFFASTANRDRRDILNFTSSVSADAARSNASASFLFDSAFISADASRAYADALNDQTNPDYSAVMAYSFLSSFDRGQFLLNKNFKDSSGRDRRSGSAGPRFGPLLGRLWVTSKCTRDQRMQHCNW
ncbi:MULTISPECIES: hypothetical protein [unclassified Bradyrhizobium]